MKSLTTTLLILLCLVCHAQDKLVTTGGDTLECKITAADEYYIQFTTPDEQRRKVTRKAISSVYYDGAWKKTYLLAASINRVENQEYGMGMLRTDSPLYEAALHLDKAGGAIIGSVALSALAVVLSAFFIDEGWTPYAVTGLAIGSTTLYISAALRMRRSAYAMSRAQFD